VKAFIQLFEEKGVKQEEQWNQLVERYEKSYPELDAQFKTAIAGELPDGWEELLPQYDSSSKPLANRIPSLIGGSADLASSNKTHLKDYAIFSKRFMKVEISGLVFVNMRWEQH
jgi:transketolase